MFQRLTATLLALVLAGCAGIRVDTDYDPTFAFGDLDTYAWSAVPGDMKELGVAVSELTTERIHRAVDDELRLKGFEKVSRGRPDFTVRTYLILEDKLDIQTFNTRIGYGHYHGPWGYGLGYGTDVSVREYTQGTLIIDFVDPDTDRLIWRGAVQSRVRSYQTPQQREARIREVVKAILHRFPPPRA